jgi:hypothetical protein
VCRYGTRFLRKSFCGLAPAVPSQDTGTGVVPTRAPAREQGGGSVTPVNGLMLVNKSSYRTKDIPMKEMSDAINRQLVDFAAAWGEITWTITRELGRQGFRIVLFDTSDEAGDLAYHDVSPNGAPYASVFCTTILDQDGTWIDGPDSISVAASHEVVETLADPACNRYADGYDGYLYAFETADATEADSYNIRGVAVSNFVYPDYFNPWATKRRGHKLDHMGVIKKPFEVRPGGYTMRHRGQADATVWGKKYPEWRRRMKLTAGSHARTAFRLSEVETGRTPRKQAATKHR